jgi:hypothetical protein
MANIPQEPTAALRNVVPMHGSEPPSGGECPACGRRNPIAAKRCACGHSLIEPRPRRSFLRRLFRR